MTMVHLDRVFYPERYNGGRSDHLQGYLIRSYPTLGFFWRRGAIGGSRPKKQLMNDVGHAMFRAGSADRFADSADTDLKIRLLWDVGLLRIKQT